MGRPDLTYLCTQASGPHVRSVARHSVNGATFRLDGLLVTSTDACMAYEAETRVGAMLRDPLDWEGDPNTVIVVGLARDFVDGKQAILQEAVDCAAKHYQEDDDDPYQRPKAITESPFCRVGELTAVVVGAMEAFAIR